AQGQNVDVDFAQIAHDGDHFLLGLAHAEDHPRLGRDLRRDALHVAADIHHTRVSSAGAGFFVKPRDYLGVVIVDLGPGGEDAADAVVVALKSGDEHFDGAIWNALVDLADRLGETPGAKVGKVVAIHRG